MKKISLFGFNFNKKLYSIGYDGPIIDGYLFFGDTQIARAVCISLHLFQGLI